MVYMASKLRLDPKSWKVPISSGCFCLIRRTFNYHIAFMVDDQRILTIKLSGLNVEWKKKIRQTVSINYFLLTSIIWVITPDPLHVENVHLSVSDWSEPEPDPANRNDRINYHFNANWDISNTLLKSFIKSECFLFSVYASTNTFSQWSL